MQIEEIMRSLVVSENQIKKQNKEIIFEQPYNRVCSHKSEYFIRIILINGVLSESKVLTADVYLFILK